MYVEKFFFSSSMLNADDDDDDEPRAGVGVRAMIKPVGVRE